jgi:protein tyrosine/serine phosphatase
MSLFKPTTDERDTLRKAVSKFAHDPTKSQLLARLDVGDSEYSRGSEEWTHLKYCIEQHHLHLQTEIRRDPKKKSARLQLDKADALARKFHPNFS